MKKVKLKLSKMSKEQTFVVSKIDELILIQSNKSIGLFDPATGKGRLNTKGCYFQHLSFGCISYELTPEQLQQVNSVVTKVGDVLGEIGKYTVIFGGFTSFCSNNQIKKMY